MADMTFNTPAGQTIGRELLILYLNTGTFEAPVWSALGKRVEESNAEMDWSRETKNDILGNVYTTMKKPVIEQSFDPMPLDGGDVAAVKLWNLAIKEQNAAALAAQDILVVHLYAGTNPTAAFAERYDGAAIEATSLGGEGGGSLGMPINVVYGGTRTIGTAALADGAVEFKADAA